MSREYLPNRRSCITQDIYTASGRRATATIGFDEQKRPKEIFLNGCKDGTDMSFILDDISVVVSIALQNNIPARDLAHSVSPEKASVLGAILDLLSFYETQEMHEQTNDLSRMQGD